MDAAVKGLVNVERYADHRQARHGHQVAPGRVPQVLDLAKPAQGRSSQGRARGSCTDQARAHAIPPQLNIDSDYVLGRHTLHRQFGVSESKLRELWAAEPTLVDIVTVCVDAAESADTSGEP